MKALTLHQPWAHLVAEGVKTVETRSWRTNYRGLLAIHAGLDMNACADLIVNDDPRNIQYRPPFDRHLTPDYAWLFGSMSHGGIVAIVELTDCWPASDVAVWLREQINRTDIDAPYRQRLEDELAFGNYSPGRWAWALRLVCGVDASWVVRGYQGLWNLKPEDEFRLLVLCAGGGVYPTRHQKLLEAA